MSEREELLALRRLAELEAKAAAAGPAPAERSTGEQIARGAAMPVGGFAERTIELATAPLDASAWVARKLGLSDQRPGYFAETAKKGLAEAGHAMTGDILRGQTELKPEGEVEEVLYGAGRGAADAASLMVPAAGVARMASPGSLTRGVARTMASRPATQAAASAVGGGVEEATDSPELGMAAAIAAPAIGTIARRAVAGGADRALVKTAPSTAKLRASADKAYDEADNVGAVLPPERFQQFVATTKTALTDEGLDRTLHPKATAALKRFEEAANDPDAAPSPQTLRRIAASAAGSTDQDEARIGKMLVREFDTFLDDAAPQYGAKLREANELWSRFRKSKLIDRAFERAENQASGVENGLRIQFRQILNNDKLRRTFSPEEIDAMTKVVEGTPMANVLRRVGRLSPGSGQQHNVFGATMGAGVGGGLGSLFGPAGAVVGAAAAPIVGYGAQRGAQAITSRNARIAQALMANGSRPPAPPSSAPEIAAARDAIAMALMARGANYPFSDGRGSSTSWPASRSR